MHEVDAHPQAVQVLRLFKEVWHDDCQPFTTTGVPLATRPDWREILETLRELNAPTLWFAFHGADEIHDRAVRGRAYPSGGDAEPLVERLDAIPETCLWRRFWSELPQMHTESWYVQQALAGTWPNDDMESYEQAYRNMISLVCRPNLDVCYGFAGQYTARYGNMRRDGIDEVLSRAMAGGSFTYDEVWFGNMVVPTIEELATRFGDASSQRIHPDSFSIRDWWTDSARRAARHG